MKRHRPKTLDDAIWDLLFPTGRFTVKALTLYHYTRRDAWERIEKDGFFDFCFTGATAFLDRNEGRSVFEPFYHACGRLYEAGEIDEAFFEMGRGITPDFIAVQQPTWVLCFSKNGSSPFLKERYAPGDGVIVGIHYALPDELQLCESIYLQMATVSYSFAELREAFAAKLRMLHRCYQADLARGKTTERAAWQVRRGLRILLSDYALCYKEHTYRREEEIRLICRVADDFTEWESDSKTERLCYGADDKLHLLLDKESHLREFFTARNDGENAAP